MDYIWINLLLRDICKIVNIHHHNHQLTISSRHGINFYITAMCECEQQCILIEYSDNAAKGSISSLNSTKYVIVNACKIT